MSDKPTNCGVNSPSVEAHRKAATGVVRVAVITISDTRTLETDTSGKMLVDSFAGAGYEIIERVIVPDEVPDIRGAVTRLIQGGKVDAIITTAAVLASRREIAHPRQLRISLRFPCQVLASCFACSAIKR